MVADVGYGLSALSVGTAVWLTYKTMNNSSKTVAQMYGLLDGVSAREILMLLVLLGMGCTSLINVYGECESDTEVLKLWVQERCV